MLAVVFTRYGSPDYLAIETVPEPVPADGEVLVRVIASSINSWDWEYLHGTPFVNRLMFGLFKPKPGKQRLGADIAGIVEAIGPNVSRFKPGDAVYGDLWDRWGGFAEYACVNEHGLETKPENVSFEVAATVPQAGVLALQGLLLGGDLGPGQTVLINGAGGGVGTFATQLAKLRDLEVTAVDFSHKLSMARSLGADHCIDCATDDFTRSGQCYDLIIDCQNFKSMFANRNALNPGGTYAMIGGSIWRVYQLLLLAYLARWTGEDRKLKLLYTGPNHGLSELNQLLREGKLNPVIDRRFDLHGVPEALRYFGKGQFCGKISISVADR